MQYMFLIYTDPNREPKPDDPGFGKTMEGYFAVSQEAREKGVLVAGDALEATDTATTVRVNGEQTQVTDGPFAETKEQLGGYYILDCKNLDEAIEYAAKIPGARHGCVEIRPVRVLG